MHDELPTVLGTGAWLKNAACLVDRGEAHWSAVHGDLGDPQACRDLDASLRELARRTQRPVAALAHDLHPDFFSTHIAQALAEEWGVPAIAVQHHHAHIGVVMADQAVNEPVVGLALDGVGLGTDGTAWGGELLWVSPIDWRRIGSLSPLSLPGGDVAAREPWRMAAAVLHALGRGVQIEPRFGDGVGATTARGVQRMLATNLNCPATSSAGRWFDAAAAALGLSVKQAHEAQAAMALEQQAAQWLGTRSAVAAPGLVDTGQPAQLDLRPLLERLFDWPDPHHNAPEAAAWFHVSLAHALADWAAGAAQQTGVRTVCLGGGCFFNAVLTEHVSRRLQWHGLRTLLPRSTGCGDAGLALGQAWVAAHRLRVQPNLSHTESATCA